MGETQIAQTVDMIIEDYYYLNIEDFKLCFSDAKKGRFGKVYDRIDGNVIYERIEQYAKNRMEKAIQLDESWQD